MPLYGKCALCTEITIKMQIKFKLVTMNRFYIYGNRLEAFAAKVSHFEFGRHCGTLDYWPSSNHWNTRK